MLSDILIFIAGAIFAAFSNQIYNGFKKMKIEQEEEMRFHINEFRKGKNYLADLFGDNIRRIELFIDTHITPRIDNIELKLNIKK